MVQIGLGQGVQPLLGYSYGAGNRERFQKILRFSLVFSTILSAVITAACYIWTDNIAGIFLEDAAAFNYSVTFARILLTSGLVFGVLYVLTIEKTKGESTISQRRTDSLLKHFLSSFYNLFNFSEL